ncbi:MAG TPA: hypothetical protein IGS40_18915 [Trichormus sp. M33_DOE_039]|nr:hypothetical protein [Trichormus sp. M33_DOE_039]
MISKNISVAFAIASITVLSAWQQINKAAYTDISNYANEKTNLVNSEYLLAQTNDGYNDNSERSNRHENDGDSDNRNENSRERDNRDNDNRERGNRNENSRERDNRDNGNRERDNRSDRDNS